MVKSISLILSLGAGFTYLAIQNFSLAQISGGEPFYTTSAKVIVWLAFCISFFAVWKLYCIEWRKISEGSVAVWIVEKLVAPVLTVLFVVDLSFVHNNFNLLSRALIILLFISLMDLDRAISRTINKFFPQPNEANQRFCYLHYPPKGRLDMLPMDLMLGVGTFILLIKKFS